MNFAYDNERIKTIAVQFTGQAMTRPKSERSEFITQKFIDTLALIPPTQINRRFEVWALLLKTLKRLDPYQSSLVCRNRDLQIQWGEDRSELINILPNLDGKTVSNLFVLLGSNIEFSASINQILLEHIKNHTHDLPADDLIDILGRAYRSDIFLPKDIQNSFEERIRKLIADPKQAQTILHYFGHLSATLNDNTINHLIDVINSNPNQNDSISSQDNLLWISLLYSTHLPAYEQSTQDKINDLAIRTLCASLKSRQNDMYDNAATLTTTVGMLLLLNKPIPLYERKSSNHKSDLERTFNSLLLQNNFATTFEKGDTYIPELGRHIDFRFKNGDQNIFLEIDGPSHYVFDPFLRSRRINGSTQLQNHLLHRLDPNSLVIRIDWETVKRMSRAPKMAREMSISSLIDSLKSSDSGVYDAKLYLTYGCTLKAAKLTPPPITSLQNLDTPTLLSIRELELRQAQAVAVSQPAQAQESTQGLVREQVQLLPPAP